MSFFAAYSSTGQIQQTLSVPDYDDALQTAASGLTFVVVTPAPANARTFMQQNYVLAGVVTPMQTMTPATDTTTIAAGGTAVANITGLPSPCTVTITGISTAGPTVVTGGAIAVSSDFAGALLISVTAAPAWLPWSETIHAV
jgi:hypothetical protein